MYIIILLLLVLDKNVNIHPFKEVGQVLILKLIETLYYLLQVNNFKNKSINE